VVRQGYLMAVVGAFLIGCAGLLVGVGCSGVRSEAPQKEEQGHTEATKAQEGSSSGAASSEEARCSQTRTFRIKAGYGVYTTNDVPGCPSGGLLSGTDKPDKLDGQDGDDEIRGLGDKDELMGGMGSDVIYGGPGDDSLSSGTVPASTYPYPHGADWSKSMLHGGPGEDSIYGAKGDDVIYAGDGNDKWLMGGAGEDAIYGGDGNDTLWAASYKNDLGADKLYCGAGTDTYIIGRLDYVDSSCEKEGVPPAPFTPNPKDVIDCTKFTDKNAPRGCK
jgi:Ca2+-binding RTX toxin-like protein